jgi:hypothetical protein
VLPLEIELKIKKMEIFRGSPSSVFGSIETLSEQRVRSSAGDRIEVMRLRVELEYSSAGYADPRRRV